MTTKNQPEPGGVTYSDLFGPLPAPTRAQHKLMTAAVAIELDDARELAFLARYLVQCNLPHTNPGNIAQWTRRSGNVMLGIQPGRDFEHNVSIGYPYGSLPRLILFWVNTEAIRTKNRRLLLGASFSAFMRELGLDPSRGGKRSDATRLREQMRRLFASSISFRQTVAAKGMTGERWLDMKVAPKGELWWDPKAPNQAALWESWIELGETFFEAITVAAVPLDMRALKALKRSPLALDLYCWATYTVHSVNRQGGPRDVPWQQLVNQMGADYGRIDNFVQKAIPALRKIQLVYPDFKFSQVDHGLRIHPGRTAIAPASRLNARI